MYICIYVYMYIYIKCFTGIKQRALNTETIHTYIHSNLF